MTTLAHEVRYTYGEYLALERSSNVKHELFDGQIFGLAGGSPQHAALTAAFVGLLHSQLAGGSCRTYSSDLRVRIRVTDLTTYPDVTVICGKTEVDPEDKHAITNPTLIVEVLSPSSEPYDRGDKFKHYRALDSLVQYVLVAQEERRVDLWTRDEDGVWSCALTGDGEVVDLASIRSRIEVSALYESILEPR